MSSKKKAPKKSEPKSVGPILDRTATIDPDSEAGTKYIAGLQDSIKASNFLCSEDANPYHEAMECQAVREGQRALNVQRKLAPLRAAADAEKRVHKAKANDALPQADKALIKSVAKQFKADKDEKGKGANGAPVQAKEQVPALQG